jgi:hypothetical protein
MLQYGVANTQFAYFATEFALTLPSAASFGRTTEMPTNFRSGCAQEGLPLCTDADLVLQFLLSASASRAILVE